MIGVIGRNAVKYPYKSNRKLFLGGYQDVNKYYNRAIFVQSKAASPQHTWAYVRNSLSEDLCKKSLLEYLFCSFCHGRSKYKIV